MVTDGQAEAALNYLAETDDLCAELKADMERCEYRLKSIRATSFALFEGSVGERNAAVEGSEAVKNAWDAHCNAIKAYNTVANKRATKTLVIDVWRSVNASRRKS